MRSYKPAEHEETKSVAPLLQFFELVHVGDTMQSMVQVYFDKELVSTSVAYPYDCANIPTGISHRQA